MSDIESTVGAEAVEVANDLHAAICGKYRSTAAVYLAIGMMAGGMAARAARPDLDGLFEILKFGAREEFARTRKELGK